MITKERLKREIDQVQDQYLDVLYQIIQLFEYPPETEKHLLIERSSITEQDTTQEWLTFIEHTYGCLADDPIERGMQGSYEVRETIE